MKVELNLVGTVYSSQPALFRAWQIKIRDIHPPLLDGDDRRSLIVPRQQFAIDRHRLQGHLDLARDQRGKRQFDRYDFRVSLDVEFLKGLGLRCRGGRFQFARFIHLAVGAIFHQDLDTHLSTCGTGHSQLPLHRHTAFLKHDLRYLQILDPQV